MRINHHITKTALTALIGLLSLLHIIAQDTLIYRYMNPINGRTPESRNFARYYLNDSVFIIEGLFDRFPVNSPYRYHFKIDSVGQWFIKYEADWKLFFNGKANEQIEILFTRVDWDIGVQWVNTYKTDGSDTIFIFYEESLKQIGNYVSIAYYFTGSSGVIAFYGLNGFWIREDKMYLKGSFDRYDRTDGTWVREEVREEEMYIKNRPKIDLRWPRQD